MNRARKQQVQHRKVIRHLGQVLRLGLEPITSAHFFVTLAFQLITLKRSVLKFSKRSIFKTPFESLRFHHHFRVF